MTTLASAVAGPLEIHYVRACASSPRPADYALCAFDKPSNVVYGPSCRPNDRHRVILYAVFKQI